MCCAVRLRGGSVARRCAIAAIGRDWRERFGFGAPLSAPSIWLHAVSLGRNVGRRAAGARAAFALSADSAGGDHRDAGGKGARRRHCSTAMPTCASCPTTRRVRSGASWSARGRASRSSWKRNCGRICCANASGAACPCCWPAPGFRRSRCRAIGASAACSPACSPPELARGGAIRRGCRALQIDRRRCRTGLYVVGNVKFDVAVDAGIVEAGRALRTAYAGAQAGLDRRQHARGRGRAGARRRMPRCSRQRPNACLLLVPRHQRSFRRCRGVAGAARREVRAPQRMASGAEAPQLPGDTPVLLVDTIGELAALYASADVAFVGGSLVPIGGHNLLEPAALGLPVLTGPSYFNSKEIAQLLLARGAALRGARCAQELAAALQRLLGAACRAPSGSASSAKRSSRRIAAASRGCSRSLNLGCRRRRHRSAAAGAGASVSSALIRCKLCSDRMPAACCSLITFSM